jgi:hypothetical protein
MTIKRYGTTVSPVEALLPPGAARANPGIITMAPGPVIERGRGCWNCLHWDPDGAKAAWNQERQGLLTKAVLHKQQGDEKRANVIATLVDTMDRLVASNATGLCGKGYRGDNPEKCIGDKPQIHYQNLCHMWDGRDGAKMATEGHKVDLLPAELNEEFQPKPDPKKVEAAKAEYAAQRAAAAAEATKKIESAAIITLDTPPANDGPSLILPGSEG